MDTSKYPKIAYKYAYGTWLHKQIHPFYCLPLVLERKKKKRPRMTESVQRTPRTLWRFLYRRNKVLLSVKRCGCRRTRRPAGYTSNLVRRIENVETYQSWRELRKKKAEIVIWHRQAQREREISKTVNSYSTAVLARSWKRKGDEEQIKINRIERKAGGKRNLIRKGGRREKWRQQKRKLMRIREKEKWRELSKRMEKELVQDEKIERKGDGNERRREREQCAPALCWCFK